MANIQARKNKDGKIISYSIRVHKGTDTTGKQLKPYTMTFKVDPNWTEIKGRKEAEKQAILFEKQCKTGLVADNRQTFKVYAGYVMELKERTGVKHSTLRRYKSLLKRITPSIGHIKLCDLKPQHINKLYEELSADSMNIKTGGKLSNKSIVEHHRLISTILAQAEKEMLIPYNVASRTTPPKVEKVEPNYFQIEDIEKIKNCLEEEHIKWKTITYLLLTTGVRRGELLGLKWDKIDLKNNQITIDNNLLYSPEKGLYESSPKTSTSIRVIAIPQEITKLLKEYKQWYLQQKLLNSSRWKNSNFLFVKDDGSPMHPDSVTDWLSKFANRHNLPHINPHAFRHTMASILYFNNVDSITISKRLGHSKVSTTSDIYAHIIKQADSGASEKIADVLLRSAN